MVRRLNQMSRQCRFKVELIQLGSVHENEYGVWTKPYFILYAKQNESEW